MYAYIKGIVQTKTEDSLVIETGGIGYRVMMPITHLQAFKTSENAVVYTHLHVREDVMALFGFKSIEDLKVFELLLSVSGVGPKAALSIVSNISASKFGLAVITDDIKLFTQAQGIGKKTAQRIILELKDKLKKEQIPSIVNNSFMEEDVSLDDNNKLSEAVAALVMLGYSNTEALKAVSSLKDEDLSVEDMIKQALRKLSQN